MWAYNMNTEHKNYQRYGNFIINKSESLGAGSFGQVWKGYLIGPNQALEPVAIKEFYNDKSNINEIQTLQILSHPNIVKYIDYKVSDNSVFMVMELCEGGTLDDLLQSMEVVDESRLVQLYSQIVRGIKFMYNKKILHRDIKPSNLLVKHNTIKIADFGTSKMNSSNELKTLVGTPLFFSPELFSVKEGIQTGYDDKSDIWALGLILYFIFNYQRHIPNPIDRIKASLPWQGDNYSALFKNIMSKPLTFKNPSIPKEIQVVLTKMLQISTAERMSFEEFFQIPLFQMPDPTGQEGDSEAQEKTINEIQKQTIGWELQELLQLKDQERSAQEEVEECRQFYELLVEELSELEEMKDYELMFELEKQYYHLTGRPEERTRILNKYYQRKSLFKDFEPDSQPQEMENNSGLMIAFQPSLESLVPMPSEKLVAQARFYIKTHLEKVLSSNGSDSTSRMLIFLVYDLFTLVTFERSWQIKRKSKTSLGDYKRVRRAVGLDKLRARIRQAAESIKI